MFIKFQNVHRLVWALFYIILQISGESRNDEAFNNMEALMRKLGQSFFEFSNGITKFNELRDSFSQKGQSIEDVNINQVFSDVNARLHGSLQGRTDAIQKVADYAEPRAFDHHNSVPTPQLPKSYFNAKQLNKPPPPPAESGDDDGKPPPYCTFCTQNCTFSTLLQMSYNEHFKVDVNLNRSSVHVPTSIYECDRALLEALVWSSDLEEPFKNNYKQNPTLGWQYFGSSTGFLRQYPAMKWPNDNSDKNSPDLYDCRFRPWYTASATSPKNLLILLDVSGSMTGLRRRIAKAVVNSILDTLTENDYVNVFKFSDLTEVLVECTNDTGKPILLQATLENLRELRMSMEQKTYGMSDYVIALSKAFDSLKDNLGRSESANCNQAIMLVTDGAPSYFQDLFNKYNKHKKIRLFTYLVGREVTDYKEVQWMACYNRGYFVHVGSLGEVQEQVFKYIPVMARPLVMSQKREVIWTPVYANHAEIVESEWQWELKTRKKQKLRSVNYKWFFHNVAENNIKKGANKSSIHAFSDNGKKDKKSDIFILALHKLKSFLDYGHPNISYKNIRRMEAEAEYYKKIIQDLGDGPPIPSILAPKLKANLQSKLLIERNLHMFKDYEGKKFNFIVSASYPVYDIRNYTNTSKERIANFLGVVGTDVSIEELKDLTSPFQLGVNAYAFAITNNGHIVFHPDFRPLYDNNILKPNYNSLDLTEVELVHKNGLFRNNDEELLQMRTDMIDKNDADPSPKRILSVRVHRDGFKRVSLRNQTYVFGKIPKTQYTLAIEVPVNATVYKGEIEVFIHWKDESKNIVTNYFDPNSSYVDKNGDLKTPQRNWRIHPDWTYCRYLTPGKLNFSHTKEDILIHFIKRIQGSIVAWKWGSITLRWVEDGVDYYVCNRDLVQSIVFDAMVTKTFGESQEILNDQKFQNLIKSAGAELLVSGVLSSFVATRSGLTRWMDYPRDAKLNPTDIPFTDYHPRAIDESWYQRSVERALIEEDSYLVSVDFDAGARNYSRVTATRAIMASAKNGKKAPVAVVGVQYDLDKFLSFFGIGPERQEEPKNICQDENFDCFILDENAFVIGSDESRDDSGQFFGDVDKYAMEALLNSSIYEEVRVVDFQAICFQQIIRTSVANLLLTPFRQISLIINWFLGYLASLLLRLNFPMILTNPFVLTDPDPDYLNDDDEDPSGDRMPFVEYASVNKTKLRPCDVEYKLFMYGPGYILERNTLDRRARLMCDETCHDYLNVQRIPFTNLIIVIVEAKCRCGRGYKNNRRSVEGKEIEYPVYHNLKNKTKENPVFSELCRIPQPPLYRKTLSHCHSFDNDESIMKEDCGGASSHKESWSIVLVVTTVVLRTMFAT